MDFDVLGKIAAPILTGVVGVLVKRYIEIKPKLITWLIHAAAIPLKDDNDTIVNTHSIVVRNGGKRTAHNIRVGHNFLPAFQINPKLYHQVIYTSSGSAEILVPTLVPGEQIQISYVYFPPETWDNIHSYCKSDEMSAKYIDVIPVVRLAKFHLLVVWMLMFAGLSTLFYWCLYWLWVWVK